MISMYRIPLLLAVVSILLSGCATPSGQSEKVPQPSTVALLSPGATAPAPPATLPPLSASSLAVNDQPLLTAAEDATPTVGVPPAQASVVPAPPLVATGATPAVGAPPAQASVVPAPPLVATDGAPTADAPPAQASVVPAPPLVTTDGVPTADAPPATAQGASASPPVSATATPLPAPRAVSGAFMRLVIEVIGLDLPVVAVGLDAQRYPIVPRHDVGWYTLSAQPGQGENIVLWGHVLRFRNAPTIPAPFAKLHLLQPGAKIRLYNEAGIPYNYVMVRQVLATPDQVTYMLPKGRERLTLISCIGDLVLNAGNVEITQRLITIAEPEVRP